MTVRHRVREVGYPMGAHAAGVLQQLAHRRMLLPGGHLARSSGREGLLGGGPGRHDPPQAATSNATPAATVASIPARPRLDPRPLPRLSPWVMSNPSLVGRWRAAADDS